MFNIYEKININVERKIECIFVSESSRKGTEKEDRGLNQTFLYSKQ